MLVSWWQPLPGPSDFYALGGRLPWSDGFDYWGAAQHLLQQGQLDKWGSRRPINGAFLASLLIFGADNLLAALLLRSLLLAMVLAGLTAVAMRRLGALAGAASGLALLVPIAVVQSTTQSEGLGVLLGMASMAPLLIAAGVRRRLGSATMGLALLSLGMMARPGAMLALPALGVGIIVSAWRRGAKAIAIAIVAVIVAIGAGVAVNAWARAALADPATSANANFAGTLLGIARGTDYYEADAWLRVQLGDASGEAERAALAYRESSRLLVSDPLTAVRKSASNLASFLMRTWPLLVLAAVGLWRSPKHERWLWISGWCGILLSVPIIFGDGGVRALAVSWPFMLLSAASAVRRRETAMETEERDSLMSGDPAMPRGVASALLWSTLAVAPVLVLPLWIWLVCAITRGGGAIESLPARGTFEVDQTPQAGAEEVDWIRNAPALHALLIAEEAERTDADARFRALPWLAPEALSRRGAIAEFGEPLDRVRTPYLLCVVYDAAQSRARVFTLPADGRTADAIDSGAALLRVDSNRLRDGGRVRVGVLVTPVPAERLAAHQERWRRRRAAP